jgi:hypothetical protein
MLRLRIKKQVNNSKTKLAMAPLPFVLNPVVIKATLEALAALGLTVGTVHLLTTLLTYSVYPRLRVFLRVKYPEWPQEAIDRLADAIEFSIDMAFAAALFSGSAALLTKRISSKIVGESILKNLPSFSVGAASYKKLIVLLIKEKNKNSFAEEVIKNFDNFSLFENEKFKNLDPKFLAISKKLSEFLETDLLNRFTIIDLKKFTKLVLRFYKRLIQRVDLTSYYNAMRLYYNPLDKDYPQKFTRLYILFKKIFEEKKKYIRFLYNVGFESLSKLHHLMLDQKVDRLFNFLLRNNVVKLSKISRKTLVDLIKLLYLLLCLYYNGHTELKDLIDFILETLGFSVDLRLTPLPPLVERMRPGDIFKKKGPLPTAEVLEMIKKGTIYFNKFGKPLAAPVIIFIGSKKVISKIYGLVKPLVKRVIPRFLR